MAVRNFWATIETEGRKVETGPRSKTESMTVTLFARENGEPNPMLCLECIPHDDGTLTVYVVGLAGEIIKEYTVKR